VALTKRRAYVDMDTITTLISDASFGIAGDWRTRWIDLTVSSMQGGRAQ